VLRERRGLIIYYLILCMYCTYSYLLLPHPHSIKILDATRARYNFENILHISQTLIIISARCVRRTNCCAIAMMFVRPSICLSVHLSGTGVQNCDRTVHFSADLSLRLDSPCSGHPDTKACPPTPIRLFPVPPGGEVRYGCAN